ncbi:MAG: carboxypeptidase-like regulatory domain-containing protein [Gemmatimonadota bacterium]|nr:carboxypeptidase-like regulatory domain-containing protein [Gemmatimonadota bacterium]
MTLRPGVPRLMLAFVVLAIPACTASITGDDPSTGLSITVLKGPIQPVAREGEDNSAPVEDATVRIRSSDGGGDAERRTGPDGSTRIPLKPGSYRIEVRECPGTLTLPTPEQADVQRGSLTPVVMMCDTGIR